MSVLAGKFREAWRRISRIDVAAVVLMFVGTVFYWMDRFAPLGALAGFLKFLGVLAAVYLFFRFIGWSKSRLLWSLRNRLIVAYVFIAVVPVLLLATLAGLGARILYSRPANVASSRDRKSTRLNSSHITISYAVFCLKKKKKIITHTT